MGTRVGARAAGAGAGAGAAAVQGKKIFPMRAKDSGHPGKIAFSPGKFADLQVSQIRRRCRRAEEVVVEGTGTGVARFSLSLSLHILFYSIFDNGGKKKKRKKDRKKKGACAVTQSVAHACRLV